CRRRRRDPLSADSADLGNGRGGTDARLSLPGTRHEPSPGGVLPSGRPDLYLSGYIALQYARHSMHGGGDSHGTLHYLAGEAVLSQLLLVRLDAHAAAVDG